MAIQKILLNDTFVGTDATELTSHTPDHQYLRSAAWATLTGHTIPQIASNASTATADATNNSAIIDVGRKNVQIIADICAGTTSGATNWIQFLMRCADVSNYTAVKVGETASTSFNLQIIECIGGTATTVLSRTCTFADATGYRIEIKCTGNLVYVEYNDGRAALSYHQISKHVAAGTYVGIWHYIAATSTTYPLVYNIKVLG